MGNATQIYLTFIYEDINNMKLLKILINMIHHPLYMKLISWMHQQLSGAPYTVLTLDMDK